MYTTACQNVVYKQVRVRPLQVWALPLRVYRNHLSDVTSRPRVSACKCNAIDCSKCSSSPAPSLKNGVVQPGREWIALLFFSANRGFDGSLYILEALLFISLCGNIRAKAIASIADWVLRNQSLSVFYFITKHVKSVQCLSYNTYQCCESRIQGYLRTKLYKREPYVLKMPAVRSCFKQFWVL